MNTVTTTPTTTPAASSSAQLVDRFGRLKAEAADISERLERIKSILIDREGECKLEGELFRLSLNNTVRSVTDWKAVALAMAKKAGVSDKVFDNAVAAATSCSTQWVARSAARVTK